MPIRTTLWKGTYRPMNRAPSAPCQGAVFQRVRTPPGNFRSGR
jgi:hypothetical protein